MTYHFGSTYSYEDYLTAKSVADNASDRVAVALSRQTREMIASDAALARANLRVATRTDATLRQGFSDVDAAMRQGFGQLDGTLRDGFEVLSLDLGGVRAGISDLQAVFESGLDELNELAGHMCDSLRDLKKIAKTPAQTAAYEQFDIAREAFRQHLFPEALESLDRAISHFRLDWRFWQLQGVIRLGFPGSDVSLVNLDVAEESFAAAARYARTDFPQDAGNAFLAAGWAAYCRGSFDRALAHTESAVALLPGQPGPVFQAAKISMAQSDTRKGLALLESLAMSDRLFLLKAAGDRDFQKHSVAFEKFIEAKRQNLWANFREMIAKVSSLTQVSKLWLSHELVLPVARSTEDPPLFDLLGANQVILRAINHFDELSGIERELERHDRTLAALREQEASGAQAVADATAQHLRVKEQATSAMREYALNSYDLGTWKGLLCLASIVAGGAWGWVDNTGWSVALWIPLGAVLGFLGWAVLAIMTPGQLPRSGVTAAELKALELQYKDLSRQAHALGRDIDSKAKPQGKRSDSVDEVAAVRKRMLALLAG